MPPTGFTRRRLCTLNTPEHKEPINKSRPFFTDGVFFKAFVAAGAELNGVAAEHFVQSTQSLLSLLTPVGAQVLIQSCNKTNESG